MNIRDFDAEAMPKNWMEVIFQKQAELVEKYKEIEGMDEVPVNIHTKKGQRWLKDFMWRTTEELAESFEALEMGDSEHAIEELADALHFLVELVILSGKDHNFVGDKFGKDDWSFPAHAYWNATYRIGLIGNTLKNKPWKQTEMPTDENKFYANLREAFDALINVFYNLSCTNDDIFNYYTRKQQVNKFRQRSKY